MAGRCWARVAARVGSGHSQPSDDPPLTDFGVVVLGFALERYAPFQRLTASLARQAQARHHPRAVSAVSGAMQLKEPVMRSVVVTLLLASCGTFQVAAQASATQQEIEALLSKGTWAYLWEITDQSVPSAAATKGAMEFFLRDGKLMGRTTHMLSGNCEFVVPVRDDGFTFEWCGGYGTPQSSVSLDRADTRFPFKNIASPRKVWFQPN